MTGPDPAGQAPWAHFGHRQRPRGISSPDGCPMGSALCGTPVGHSAHLPTHHPVGPGGEHQVRFYVQLKRGWLASTSVV